MDSNLSKVIENASEASHTSVKNYLSSPADRKVKLQALDDAKRLVTELQDGDDAFFYRIEQVAAAYALRFIMAIGAFDKIPKEGSITAESLAAAIGSEKTLIVRMMRLIAAVGIFEEVSQDEYALTRRSLNLSDPSYANWVEYFQEDVFGTFAKLHTYYSSHPLESPTSPCYNPYSWAFDMEGQDFISVAGRTPEKLRKFSIGISGTWAGIPVLGIFPFEKELASLSAAAVEHNRVFMVDVGGSQGKTMKTIREGCPSLKGRMVVQDQAGTIDNIPAGYLPAQLDIQPQVHDFWTAQPVRDATVYYLRRVLHDWPDDMCQRILKHIVDAMAPDSKILVAEILIPTRVQSMDTYTYVLDLTMMLFAGKERTEADWRTLFDSVGLEMMNVWRAEVGTQAVMEGQLKKR